MAMRASRKWVREQPDAVTDALLDAPKACSNGYLEGSMEDRLYNPVLVEWRLSEWNTADVCMFSYLHQWAGGAGLDSSQQILLPKVIINTARYYGRCR